MLHLQHRLSTVAKCMKKKKIIIKKVHTLSKINKRNNLE